MLELVARAIFIASIISGECGPVEGACRQEVARAIVTRGSTEGFYGRGEPGSQDLALGLAVATGVMPKGQYRFVYSLQDQWRMGWRRGDLRICGSGLCVNFARGWPGE